MNKSPENGNREEKITLGWNIAGAIGIVALLAANVVVFGQPEMIPQEVLQEVSLDQLKGTVAGLDIFAAGVTASIYSGSFL